MSRLAQRVLYYGRDKPLPERLHLRAGPLRLVFDDGDLRYVRLGDREVLRRVYAAVRDRNWDTVLPVMSNLHAEVGADSFRITYNAEHRQHDLDFRWKGTISGDARGIVTFEMDGRAHTSFLRNRIGFCVLHPMRECAGARCEVEKADGSTEASEFPRYISPHQPFMDMRSISHEVTPGVWADVRFEGEIFETEDHRNWTDASFKTYCTPLALPFPVPVEAGTEIRQVVTLSIRGERPAEVGAAAGGGVRLAVSPRDAAGFARLPRIGLGCASHGMPLSDRELDRLRALNLSHLRVDIDLAEGVYESRLRQAAGEARALGTELEVAVTVSDAAQGELEALGDALARLAPPVCRWLVFHADEESTTARWVSIAREHLGRYGEAALIVSGAPAYFTELNRSRPEPPFADAVCYSLNPQVHAFDNSSMVETLEAQTATVESARQFAGDLPVVVSPVTLKPRFNPNATGPESEPLEGELPSQVDVRQMSLFGAAWTAGSLKYLGQSAVDSVTYFETTGWRGVMETGQGSQTPDAFRSLPGCVFPMYHVFADVGEFSGGLVVPAISSDPLVSDGLALIKNGRTRVLLSNMTAEPQEVTVENLDENVRLRYLDETNAEEAMLAPETFRGREGELMRTRHGALQISLLPYSMARIDTA